MSEPSNAPAFSDDQRRTLALVLDEIVPRSEDGKFPGAGELGLADQVGEALGMVPGLRTMIAEGLSALDALARRRNADGFAVLSPAERVEVMDQLASSEHAFPPMLVLHTYAAYYQHTRVLEALGLDPRPPHPKGYEMEPDNLDLLDVVRRRRGFYRE